MSEMWAHQLEGKTRAEAMHNFAFFFQMGCGKTRTLLETLKAIYLKDLKIHRTLIFCPPIVISNWADEFQKYTELKKSAIRTLTGEGKKRLNVFSSSNADIFITNYEALLMKDLYAAFLLWSPEIIVFDESHRLKSPDTNRSKLAYNLACPFDKVKKCSKSKPRTFLLSGSPILNSPMDIFQQYKVMDAGRTFGSNFYSFRAQYFVDRNRSMPQGKHFPNWTPMIKERDGVDALGLIKQKIAETSMRVEKKDCLDLPPEVSIPIKVGMSPEQARLYKEMKNELLTEFKSKTCVATIALTKALRLLQITSGYLSVEREGDTSERMELEIAETPKIEALRDLLEEIVMAQKQKVLVWAVFRFNYAQIRAVLEDLKIKYVEVHGDVSDIKKRLAVKEFQENPDIKVFLGHPGSGGIGINLTAAGYSIFYSRNFSLEQYLQSRARNHRGGSKEAGHVCITHYDLIVENTIDELALKMLSEKKEMGESLLNNMIEQLELQV